MVSLYQLCVLAYLGFIALAVVADDVLAGSVGIGEGALCTGHIRTSNIDLHLILTLADTSLALELPMYKGIELHSFAIGGGNN